MIISYFNKPIFKWIVIYIILSIIALGFGYYLWNYQKNLSNAKEPVANQENNTSCGEYCIRSFSPNYAFELRNRGTSPERTFEIINTKTQKNIATLEAYGSYLWLGDSTFIFGEPTKVADSKDERPWESGSGSSIKKLDLTTGNTMYLQKADSLHDYTLEKDSNGSIIGGSAGIWITIKTYPSSGDDRFTKPEIHHWIMDPQTGKLLQNIDHYSIYQTKK